ncbi:DUF3304 domain-containing protein [Burkholderia pseudomallei]|uniref:DUF3304 domain-containing protein n=1 Tax=Burkholderia pseudomallei TaxID=28450 RepID=UPI00050EA188|nr:DUF3304 domain-containing protein [Burkholderia pseudomallei]KGC51985.1 hypothetical protein DO65_3810 [Burkholderia pseudomallei]KGW91768.1 hypothetical protein Y030_3702 [Burkholderia pseudomallei MSHR332]MCW0128499.1 DUF3304 domain-containing protein [Burkholderia pseudomallei]VCE19759.1 lipoprotein [Burkholderia pseudomallei]VCE46792.1 lipoprotein [Burkholderia pseudomallei]
MCWLALLGSVAACSRAVSEVSPQAGAKGAAVSQAGDDTMSLKLNALNDTDVPIGAFYVDGTWGSTVASRIGSGGGQMICCASAPGKWHPGLTVTLRWQDDTLYKKDPDAMASRVVSVGKHEHFSDGFLWVLFFPNDRIKVYASQWMPGFPGFPEGLQTPDSPCPEHFTPLSDDPRCSQPGKRIKL